MSLKTIRNVKCEIPEEKLVTESSNIVQTREENPQRYPEEIRKSEDNYENIVSDEDVNVNKERRLSTEDTSEKTEQKFVAEGDFRVPRKQSQNENINNLINNEESSVPESPNFGNKVDKQDFEYISESIVTPVISEVEKELLKTYPGVSINLDDTENPLAQEILSDLALTRSKPENPSQKCTPTACQLPSCHCGGPTLNHPEYEKNGYSEWPQIVLLTFEGAINDLNKRLFEELFTEEKVNPNGCPISATFYVSHEWTDYSQVENLHKAGHEIASHSISYSFGELFSKEKWAQEMAGQRSILAKYANINPEEIRGIRAPFLAIGGNNMFSMLYDANFTYDSRNVHYT